MAKSYSTVAAPAVTNLNGLASAAYWVSPVFDNNSELAYEVEKLISILTTTTAGADGSIDVYVAGSVDGGTEFAGNITNESNATWTPLGDAVSDLKKMGSLKYTNETTARTRRKRFKLGDVPKHFKLVIFNGTGTAFGGTTECKIEWNAIKY